MTPEKKKEIDEQCEEELRSVKDWMGDWAGVKELIAKLEANDNEAAAERYYSDTER